MTNELFLEVYDSLVAFAKNACATKGFNIEPEELVSEAYLVLNEKGLDFTVGDIKKEILNYGFVERGLSATTLPIFIDKISQSFEDFNQGGERCCRVCKLVAPEIMFHLRKRKGRIDAYENICKECEDKRKHKYKPSIPKSKPAEYYKRYRALLSTSYIIDVLKKQKHLPENITNEMINEKRTQLYFKRQKNENRLLQIAETVN